MAVTYSVVAISTADSVFNTSSAMVVLDEKLVPFLAAHLLETRRQQSSALDKIRSVFKGATLAHHESCVVYPPGFCTENHHYLVVNEHEVQRWLASRRPNTCHILTNPRSGCFILHGE